MAMTSIGLASRVTQEHARLSRQRADILSLVQEELENRRALAQSGNLLLGTFTRNATVRGYPVVITTTVTGPTANTDVFQIESTATWNDGRAQQATLRTRAWNKEIGEVISVFFNPATSPLMAQVPNFYMGYGVGRYMQKRWTRLSTVTGVEPISNSKNQPVLMRFAATPSTPILNPSLSTFSAYGIGRSIFEGGLFDATNNGEIVVDLTNIPYANYEIVVYLGMDVNQGVQRGLLELDGVRRFPVTTLDFTVWVNWYDVLLPGRNMVILPGLSGGSHRIRSIPATPGGPVLPISAIQVAQR